MEEKIIEIIEKEYGLKFKKDNNKYFNYTFYSDLGFDSLRLVEVIMECENTFNVKLNDGDIMRIRTINDLITTIKKK